MNIMQALDRKFLRVLMLVSFVTCMASFSGFGQLNRDSLQQIIKTTDDNTTLAKAYLDYGYQLYRSEADSAIVLAGKALAIGQATNNNRLIFSSYNLLGLSNQTKGLYNLSLEYFNRQLTYLPNNDLNRAKALHNMALVYRSLNKNNEALKSELGALKISEINQDSVLIGVALQTMGNIYREMGDYAQAETYNLKAIQILENLKNTGIDNRLSMIANAYTNYGNLLQVAGRLKEAVEKHEIAIKIHNESGDLFNKAISYENLGNAYLLLKEYDLAITQYNIAKDLMQQLNSATDVGYELLNIADVYIETNKYADALTNVDSALAIFEVNKAFNFMTDAYDKKYKIYERINDPINALKFYKKYITLTDSLNAEEKKIEVLRLKEEFESTQKEQQIERLKTENQLKEKEKQIQIAIRNIAILVIIIIIILGVVLFNRSKIKEQLRQLHMRNEIASDLHDDIGSTLSSISMYSEIVKQQISPTHSAAMPLLEKMSSNSKAMIENMSDIVWAIKPSNDSFGNIINRMYDFASEQCSLAGIDLQMPRNEKLNSLKFSMEKRRDIYLIFKEAINNAVKYSGGSQITVTLSVQHKLLIVEIADNGSGFNPDAAVKPEKVMFSGNGIANMKTRASKLNGTLSIKSALHNGTQIILNVPLD